VSVAQIGPVHVPQSAPPPDLTPVPAVPQSAPPTRVVSAGFWLRGAAFLIDTMILSVPFAVCALLYPSKLIIFPAETAQSAGALPNFALADFLSQLPRLTAIGFLFVFFVGWAYYAWFESSPWQGTPGKRLLGLYVTDMRGRPVTFWRASARYLGRRVTDYTLLVGYILAGFTEKKQALHDLIASCLVLRRQK
jgi:uncharacterized RDD family membrane protein YckC